MIETLAERYGDAPALLSDRETLSFRGLFERSDRYARWALAQGVKPGDAVALLMPNRPDYLAAWIGITRVGGVAALLNTNLVGASLAHCVAAAAPAHAIVADELAAAWDSAVPDMGAAPPRRWNWAGLEEGGTAPLRPADRPTLTTADRALMIYTSGTTGLPKAAHVSHHRVMMWTHWFAGLMGTTAADRMYNCLPLYHSVGGVAAAGAALVSGGSTVIAEKFSARSFWTDVVRWDCTLVQYIGELCRYLLNARPSDLDRAHRLRLACGNGLRPDVWEPFRTRFAVPRILEFYAATEGNVSLYNVEGRPGAVGRIPPYLAARFPVAVVRHDPTTGAPLRGPDGFCRRCARDEPGEMLGRIAAAGAARAGRFEGYTAADDTARKVLRDVFAPGDAWFRTGDLMRVDPQGYFFFVDRIGDTFRWKGENVSTAEVAAVLAACPGVLDATVYGVAVPGAEGRAGMAALVTDARFDPAVLREFAAARLPSYARPLVLRLCDGFAVTETFKTRKADLARQGFNPAVVADPLLFDEPGRDAYVPLDLTLYARIERGTVRV